MIGGSSEPVNGLLPWESMPGQASQMRDVLFVTKPVEPPWNDGTKNLVRDLVQELGDLNVEVPSAQHASTRIHRALGGTRRARVAALRRVLLGRRARVTHFVFSPSPRVSRLCQALCRARSLAAVHTVPSAPGAWSKSLFFAQHTVFVSEASHREALRVGVPEARVSWIPVPLRVPEAVSRADARAQLGLSQERTLILFPGDVEEGCGAMRVLKLVGALPGLDAQLVMACRTKTARHNLREKMLRCYAQERLPVGGVQWLGETTEIHRWLAAADLVAMPAASLVGKVDTPLVLLEAMSLGTPVLVLKGTAAAELSHGGGALAVEPSLGAMVNEVRALLRDNGLREKMAAAGQKYVAEVHDPKRVAALYRALYERIGTSGWA